MVDVGYPSRHRIIDRDHRERRLALFHRREGILEGAAGYSFGIGIGLNTGNVGISASFALIGDLKRHRSVPKIKSGPPSGSSAPPQDRREYRHPREASQRAPPRSSSHRQE